MTILLTVLALSAGGGSAVQNRPPLPARVDRRVVAMRVVRDLDRDGLQDLCLRTAGEGRTEIAVVSAASGSLLWRADPPAGLREWTTDTLPGALAPLGDLDGDGLGEIAALWRDADASGEQHGAVLALHAGKDGHVIRTVELGRGAAVAFATSLTAAGDLDGDLLPDVIALAPRRDLFPGWITAISSATCAQLWSAPTGAAGDENGTAIALVRDLDRDSTVDLALVVDGGLEILSGRDGRRIQRIESAVVGARRNEPVPEDVAEAEPIEALPESSPSWLASGALVVVGDLDGDGAVDLLVPSRTSSGHASSCAIVSTGASKLLARRELPVWSLELGVASFRIAGDFDGDTRIDLLCGDPGWNLPDADPSSALDVGAVRVLAGNDGRELRAWHGGPTLRRLGAFTAIAGDIDRDGANDVWMTAVDTSSRPRELVGLASGKSGAFLRWIDLGRIEVESRP